jgi:hypothetical protein
MRVNPVNDGSGANMSQKLVQSLSFGKSAKFSSKRQDKRACNKLLRKIVDG